MPYTTLPSVDELYKKNLEAYKPQQDEEIAEKNKIFDARYQNTQNLYGKTIQDTEASYDEAQQKNELQKYINEKQLQENMANLGLTDSGLNRTQQTAVQLSYANNKADLNRQRQSAVDALTLEMNSALTTIDADRATAVTGVKDKYTSLATSNAQSTYSANLDYVQKAQEAAKENEKLYSFGYYDSETKRYVYYDQDGNKRDVDPNVSPYTGTTNSDVDYGFFESSPHQPDNIGNVKLANTGFYTNPSVTGRSQKIWEANGKYYIWEGEWNRYIEVDISDVADGFTGFNHTKIYTNEGLNSKTGKYTFVDEAGNKTEVAPEYSPYTNDRNPDVKNGHFKTNTYQPDNINGERLTDTGKQTVASYTGTPQTIWWCNGKYWIWRGDLNRYSLFEMDKLKSQIKDKTEKMYYDADKGKWETRAIS